MKHTPEPWKSNCNPEGRGWSIMATEGKSLALVREQIDIGMSKANAERIVSCVNACTDIPTSALEEGVVGEMLEVVRNIYRIYEKDVLWSKELTSLVKITNKDNQ